VLLIEEPTQACVDFLTTSLPAELAVVKAKYAAGDAAASPARNIVLNTPAVKFGKPEAPGFGMPVIYVYSPDTQLAEFGTSDTDHGDAQYNVVLNIDCYLVNDDNEASERVYARFAEAINNILYRTQNLAAPAINVISVMPKRFIREHSALSNSRVLRVDVAVRIESLY